MAADLRLRLAELSDGETIIQMMEERALWLHGREIEQWAPGMIRKHAFGIMQRIQKGQSWICLVDDEVAGTVTLMWEDPEVWGEQPPVAGYVHGLATWLQFAGRGIGASMLDWAADQCRACGRDLLRLDCIYGNPGLAAYYEGLGFRFIRTKEMKPGETRALYERAI